LRNQKIEIQISNPSTKEIQDVEPESNKRANNHNGHNRKSEGLGRTVELAQNISEIPPLSKKEVIQVHDHHKVELQLENPSDMPHREKSHLENETKIEKPTRRIREFSGRKREI
jgi:hypothetical protein